jgi:ribonuclease P protein component
VTLTTIKHARTFQAMSRRGIPVGRDSIVLKYMRGDGQCSFAFVVSRKVGNAVVRNKVKRRLRAIVRELLPSVLGGYYYLIIAKPSAAGATFAVLQQEVTGAFDTMKRKSITRGESEAHRRPRQYRHKVRQYPA